MEYQPVVELASGRTVGVEALLRWRHPRRGVLKPVDFLPVAENSGIVVQIGTWALGEALQQLRGWRQRIPAAAHLWTAVNVSARQLASGDLVSAVSKAIDASGLEPESLHIELTESAVIDLVDWSLVVLRDLHTLGVELEIDDFGTATRRLADLKQLPIDGVKIDRVFVDGLGADGRDAVIIEAVVSLARRPPTESSHRRCRDESTARVAPDSRVRLWAGLPVERALVRRRPRALARAQLSRR